jgi:hypothetical protein
MKNYFGRHQQEFIIFLIFLFLALFIVILHLLFHPIRVLGMDTSIFYMDEKNTLAAFFSTVTAFLVGYLAFLNISKNKIKLRKIININYGLFFILLALDEYFEIHEYVNIIIKSSLKEEGIFKILSDFSWIFPLFLVIILVFSLLLIKIKLTTEEIRKPIIIGVFCFLFVLIFELFGSATYGQNIFLYFVAIEEGLEMIGVSFFLLAGLIEKKY